MPSPRELSQTSTSGQLELIQQFQDRPISLADASLVAAEALNLTRVFTYYSDFWFYTAWNGATLRMYPEDFLHR